MKRSITLIAALALVTGLLAALHLSTRADVTPGSLVVEAGESSRILALDALPLAPVAGVIVNGRGEEKPIDGQGIALKELLALAEAEVTEKVTVTASDEYAAVVTKEEIDADGRVWLLKSADDMQLIVFGDPNAKRAVKHVERVRVE